MYSSINTQCNSNKSHANNNNLCVGKGRGAFTSHSVGSMVQCRSLCQKVKEDETRPVYSCSSTPKETHHRANNACRNSANPIPLYGLGFTDWRREVGTEEYAECANTGDEGPVMGGVWLR